MKFFSLQKNLKQGLFNVSHIANKNVNLPILSNIMVKAKKGNIKLIATNLEVGITSLIRGKIEKEGSITIESKIISDCINLLPSSKIGLEQKDNNILIDCDNYKTKVKGQSVEDFPLIPVVERKTYYSAPINEFKQALNQVVFAVSLSESRAELSSVLFSFDKNSLTLVATDSYRLAEKKIDIKTNGGEGKKVMVPAKTLQELVRILSGGYDEEDLNKDTGEINFYITENQILFTYSTTELVSRLIEGHYPDYQQIIPNNSKTKILIDRAELIRAVKVTSLFSKTGINDINLDFPAGKNQIIVSAASGQTGENITNLKAKVTGSDNSIVLNYRYLLDGLSNINDEMVSVEIIDGNTPCVLRPEKEKDYLYIIMPIKQ